MVWKLCHTVVAMLGGYGVWMCCPQVAVLVNWGIGGLQCEWVAVRAVCGEGELE